MLIQRRYAHISLWSNWFFLEDYSAICGRTSPYKLTKVNRSRSIPETRSESIFPALKTFCLELKKFKGVVRFVSAVTVSCVNFPRNDTIESKKYTLS